MQSSFFDLENRHQQLEQLGDPLPKLSALVDWEAFRPMLDRVRQTARKSAAGRKPYDVVLMFKILFLLRRFNGVPQEHFALFLKEFEWRFNSSDPRSQLRQLTQWVRSEMLVI